MNKKLKKQTTDFLKCGLIGWGMECLWTGCGSLCGEKNKKMPCQTSIWMFPIYGSMALLRPFFLRMQKLAFPVRGCIYALMIFAGEFLSGRLLQKHQLCPWDYTSHHWNIQGIIRLDFFPYWFATGLFFEKLLTEKPSSQSKG